MRRVGLGVAVLLLALAGAELALRALGSMPDFRDAAGTRFALDRERLFRIVPHSGPEVNALGFREVEVGPKDPARRRIAVLGDGFVYADHVNAIYTLPRVLAQQLAPLEVLSFAVPGDGPDQSYARLERDVLPLAPDVVVLVLNAADDFADLAKNQLYVNGDGGRLAFDPQNPVARELPALRSEILLFRLATGEGLAPFRARRLAPVIGPDSALPLADGDAAARQRMAGVLALFRERLDAAGVPLQVLIVPSREAALDAQAPARSEQLAEALCKEAGLRCLSLLEPMRVLSRNGLYEEDGRPSYRGLAVAGRRLAREMRESGLVRVPPR